MKKVAITFGSDHDAHHLDIAERISEGYVVIEAPDREVARRIAFAIFEKKWAFDYDLADVDWQSDIAKKGFYPAGELLRIAWLGFDRQAPMVAAIEGTYEAAEGGSNDAEIESLQEARDMLATVIDYTPADEREWDVPEPYELTIGPDIPTHLRASDLDLLDPDEREI